MIKGQIDIAKKFKVSQMTVSRALNGEPGVSEKLQKKITAYAEKHGFSSNRVASGLARGRTKTIGLLIPNMAAFSFYPELTDVIEETLRKNDYCPLLYHTGESYQQLEQGLRLLLGHRAEGFIIVPPLDGKKLDAYKLLEHQNIPYVFVDRFLDGLKTSYVISDANRGEYDLVKYLISLGHRRICLVKGVPETTFSKELFSGYQKALQETGLQEWTVNGGYEEEDGQKAAVEIIKTKLRPSAIITVNDPVAVGVISVLKEKKLNIPGSISVAGFSDIKFVSKLTPSLTTVKEDVNVIGEKAATILLEMIRNGKKAIEQVRVSCKLIVRDSTGVGK